MFDFNLTGSYGKHYLEWTRPAGRYGAVGQNIGYRVYGRTGFELRDEDDEGAGAQKPRGKAGRMTDKPGSAEEILREFMGGGERRTGQGGGILSGTRVLDFGTYIFGPAAATMMADHGATVIKIEPPDGGDPYRHLPSLVPMPACEVNYCWLLEARNKLSVALNIKDPKGREILLELADRADVLVTNLPPQVLGRFDLDYESLHARNERLVYAHATGYGEEGEEAGRPAFDTTAYWARSGLMDIVHASDALPALTPAGFGDHPSSLALFSGIMLALLDRARTGKGTKVSSSLMANGVWSNSCVIQAGLCDAEFFERRTRQHTYNPLTNHYLARDGRRFLLVGIRGEKDWQGLCEAVGHPEWIEEEKFETRDRRRENSSELIARLDEIFAERDWEEWRRTFEQNGITFGAVATLADVKDDPQLEANGVFSWMDHPRHGRIKTINAPFSLRGAEMTGPYPAPELGEHTAELLRAMGYDEAKIVELAEQGAVGLAEAEAPR